VPRLAVHEIEGQASLRRSADSSELRRDGHAQLTERRGVVVDSKQESRKQLVNDALDIVVLAAAALLTMALVTLF
jgi:hypothetical protein